MFRNVEEVVEFSGIIKNKHLTYSLKLMIAREIEQEKIRRLESSMKKSHRSEDKSKDVTMDNCVPHDHEMDFESLPPPSSTSAGL